jgi:hypothetical protein
MITLDEARSVMETLTDNMSESQLHKLVAESGRIALPDLLKFMVDKVRVFFYLLFPFSIFLF